MSRTRHSRTKSARIAAATALVGGLVVPVVHAATVSTWVSPVSGTWTDGARWSTSPDHPNNGTPAGVTYDAVIAAGGGPYTVGLSSDITVSSFTLNAADATLAQSAGTFNAGAVSLQAGTYFASGGTLKATSISGPAGVSVGAGNFTLDLGTLSTSVNASAGANLTMAGSWTNSGAISVTGGSLTLAGTPAASLGAIALTNSTLNVASVLSTAQVTSATLNNSNIAIVPGGFVNNTAATIALSPGAPTWTLAGGTLGGGAITSTGGAKLLLAPGTTSGISNINLGASVDVPAATTLVMSSGVTNAGVISVGNGGTLSISGTALTANLGTIQNTSGGRVVIAGALSNVSSTLTLTPSTGPWILTGTIGNGTIAGSAPNNLVVIGGTLTGLTVAGDVSVGDGVNPTAATMIASAVTSASGGRLLVNALPASTNVGVNVRGVSPTYGGTGEVVFNGSGDGGFIRAETAGQTLTFTPGITVRTGTRGGVVGSAGTGVRNNGTLSAQTAGRTLSVLGTLNNQGTVEARNGGTLQIGSTPSNLSGTTLTGGTWGVYDGSTLAFPGGATVATNAANVTLSGATSTFLAINALAANSGSLTITGGKRFTTAGNLNNSGGVTVGPSSTLKVVGDLTNTGKVDLAGGTLVLDYGGVSPADTLRMQLAAGRAGGSWTGVTGVTSSTAAADPQLRMGVGYIEAAALGVTTWAGVDVDGTAVLTKLTYYGDANFDGEVDADDFARADRGRAMGIGGWMNGDFDYSGAVDAADYLLMDRVYVQQGGPLAPLLALRAAEFGEAYGSQLLIALPEPSCVVVSGGVALAVAMRRRRRD